MNSWVRLVFDMARGQDLLRDIAKLILKYDLEDWRFVIGLLRDRGPEYAAVEKAITEATAKKPIPSKRATESNPRSVHVPTFEGVAPERAEALSHLYQRIRSQELLPTASALRVAYLSAGGKEKLPTKRDSAIRLLVQHLSTVSDSTMATAIKQIGESRPDLGDEYTRWFSMILDKRSDPGET